MALKPCITCGTPSSGSRCPAHARNGSTRQWRTLRALILRRDRYRCVLCGEPGNEVDHIVPVVDGGPDTPANCRTLCRACHRERSQMSRD